MTADKIKTEALMFIKDHPLLSSKEIHDSLDQRLAYATVKRILSQFIKEGMVIAQGRGKATRYKVSSYYELLYPIGVETYFKKEQDDRRIQDGFNFLLINDTLQRTNLFDEKERAHLNSFHTKFEKNIAGLSSAEYSKELERLAIDLSWKSSQIEGNTYSLLETERLLKEQEIAKGKPKDDATMLLNHKEAINFIIEHPDYVVPLTVRSIEDIHSILIKDLGVDRNIRQRRVGVTGTNYKPLDNEYQIREALNDMCMLINKKEDVFDKSLLALTLLSYIQAFADGNKRTARIVSNAILIAHRHCPLSFRTVDPIDYKKAMLIFYEQNNIHAFKEIFITQYEFAVNTYF
ncbi:MAG: Fic family protein [Sediminibacterium magnilacihabitans]|jgi:Fic family protein|nr:Fic family protein [Sediminibacterium magnilacihabitans]PQV60732.1 Fic/DOC family protein [Sediminibacterium magnilacihabitans]